MTLRRVVSGILIASTPCLAQQQVPYPTRQVELVRVVGDDPSAGATIGTVGGFDVGPGGVLYVLDRADVDVKVFDATGRFVRKFGREGGGPGEFRRPIGVTVGDAAVTVRDQVNGAVTFDLNGRHMVTRGLLEVRAEGTPVRHGMRIVEEIPNIRPTPAEMMSGRGPSSEPRFRRVLLHWPTGRIDTLASIRSDVAVFTTTGRGSLRPSGFGDAGTWAVSGDSLVAIADGYEGVVRWYAITASGAQLKRTASLGATGTEVTRSDVTEQEKRLVAATMSLRTSGGVTTRVPGPTSGTMSNPPPRWSVATRAMFSTDGTLWVGAPRDVLTMLERGWTREFENNVWTVFPPNGSPFTVALSSEAPLTAVHGDQLYSVPAEQGAATINVYRVLAR